MMKLIHKFKVIGQSEMQVFKIFLGRRDFQKVGDHGASQSWSQEIELGFLDDASCVRVRNVGSRSGDLLIQDS